MKRTRETPSGHTTHKAEITPWIDIVAAKVKALDNGIIEIVIHDGRVVQIEQMESFRFDDAGLLKDPKSVASNPAETPTDEN